MQVMLYYFNSPNRLRYLSSPNPDQQQIPDELIYTMLKREFFPAILFFLKSVV